MRPLKSLSLLLSAAAAAAARPSLLTSPFERTPQQHPFPGNDDRLYASAKVGDGLRVIRQNDSLCDAGADQWTGTVPLGEDRNMFFWYFESRVTPETAPLIIWLNGGPGASSMLGALFEVGACSVSDDGKGTARNPRSWTNFANVLFLDQPIGVGFSRPDDPTLWASNLLEAGIDFDKFLDQFFKLFPGIRNNQRHLAGESFGGKYVPVYASMTRNIFDSVILIDPLIDFSNSQMGLYDHFCFHDKASTQQFPRYFNSTTCELMEESIMGCDKAGEACRITYNAFECRAALETCTQVSDFFQREVVPGGRHPYDDRLACDQPPLCGHLGMEPVKAYLNLAQVQAALGFTEHFDYLTVNMEMNLKWSSQSDVSTPSSREISDLLDVKRIPVLVMNGANDVVTNAEGLMRTLDGLEWSHRASFRSQRLSPFYYPTSDGVLVQGGTFKSRGNLTLVVIDNAGHMSPRDQPDAVMYFIKKWLAGLA